MKKVSFCTLGCKVNQYETEAMTELFKNSGYSICNFEDVCDIYIINTCTVTGMSDKKSRQMIRRAKHNNPDAIVAVVGCYSQVSPDEVAKIDGVNLVLGTKERKNIVELVEQCTKQNQITKVEDALKNREYEDIWVTTYDDRTRAYVKIEDGCTEFCSYCIIPYARGPVRSRPIDDIVAEVVRLAMAGFKEVVLTGIHIGSYGRDLKDVSLLDVLIAVHNVDGIERIRLGSVEPRTLTEDFISTISRLPKICDHFHISLQSGCDATLERMNRKYTTDEYYKSTQLLRKYYKNPAITTDIMVGFAGETDAEFEQSLAFMQKIAFAEAHVFAYSIRKGTKAEKMPGHLPSNVKEQRSKRMLDLCNKLHNDYVQQFVGTQMPVLVERHIGGNIYEGHMTNYIKVHVKSDTDISHKIINVTVTKRDGPFLSTF